MNKIDRYLRLARNIVVRPKKEDIDEKIINRIENLSDEDKKLLDDRFMDYIRRNNSRLYLFSEDIKNNPGKLVAVAFIFLTVLGIAILGYRLFFSPAPEDQK